MNGKYYGVTEEQVRQEVRRQLQQQGPNYADVASKVAQNLGRDQVRKQRILTTSPHLAYAIDAEELGSMSASELARYELKQLGINCSDSSDPLEVRDAYHAGRMHERQIKHNPGMGNSAMRSAQDGSGESAIDKYINGET